MINELIQRLQIYQEEDRNKDVLRNNPLGQIEDGWKNLKIYITIQEQVNLL